MKRAYVKMVMTPSGVELNNHILHGSLTAKKIKVNEVEVEPYSSGFKTDSHLDDFEVINFD